MDGHTKSARLFDNSFLERLTRVHHNTPLWIFLPSMSLCLYYVLAIRGMSPVAVTGYLVLGGLIWSLFEYLLHRVVFHYEPKSGLGKKLIYIFHGIHHDFPMEADRLVMPPVSSIPMATVVLGVHLGVAAIFGAFLAGFPVFVGFLAGYLYYEFVHYSVHHKKKGSFGWVERQRKDHLLHHFKDHTHRFGVTSPLWDYIFGTYR